MSASVEQSGPAALIAVALIGLAAGVGLEAWLAEERADAAALEEEMASALRRVEPVGRRTALLGAIAKMSPETLPALRAGLEREFRLADSCVIPPFAAAWADFDATGAFEAATREWDDLAKRSQATTEIAYHLGRTGEIDRARNLTSRLATPRVRFATWAGLADGMIRSGDLDGATAFLLEMPDTADRNRIIERFLRDFALNRDLEGALAWADAIPDDAPRDIKSAAFRLTARWMSGIDPKRAAAWVESQPAEAKHAYLADLAVAEEWIEHDAEAAMDWILSRTVPGERRLAMRRTLGRFVELDAQRAARWMDQHDPLGDVERGIPPLARALATERPREALAWAGRLSRQRQREGLIADLVREWKVRDPEAASAWLAEQDLSESLRQRIEEGRSDAAEGEAPWQ